MDKMLIDFSDLRQRLKAIEGAKVVAGIQAEPGKNFHGDTVSSDEEMLTIAHVHEYGCDITVTPKMRAWLHYHGIHLKKSTTKIHIPERSFVRSSQANDYAENKRDFDRLSQEYLEGKIDRSTFMDKLGTAIVTRMVAGLGVGTHPISEATKKLREVQMPDANPTPLVVTGSGLQNHITHRAVFSNEG